MPSKSVPLTNLEFHPVTSDRWHDLEKLFGERGACGGCWCMWWRLKRSEFERQTGQGNKRAMKKIVASGQAPGILAYAGSESIGWCSVAPRQDYSALERSRVLKRIDDEPVWSVVCFFVARPYRRQGTTTQLLAAAVEYARQHGAKIIEAYPVEPRQKHIPDAFAYTGIASIFREAGFIEIVRRSETRPIMRCRIE
jgi:GNAT superfamily N-acetyltransferase